MKRTMMLVTPMLMCCVLLTGCYRPYGAEPDRMPSSQYPKISTQGWLRNDFYEFDAPDVTPEAGNRPMSVSVYVRLKEAAWEDESECQYRFIFLDERGVPLDPDPTWHYRQMEPRVITTLQGSAPDLGAVDWRCEIRNNRQERLRWWERL